jgi:hypothetical protein
MAFKPGQSGNPGGRVKDKLWREALLIAVNRVDDGDPRPRLARIAEAVARQALGGDMQAVKEIGDRLDGKAPQPIEGGDTPIQFATVSATALTAEQWQKTYQK